MARRQEDQACELLTAQEIALILRADPSWVLPLACTRRRERMAEARTATVSAGSVRLSGVRERRAIREWMRRNQSRLLPAYMAEIERYRLLKQRQRKAAAEKRRRKAA